MLHVSWAWLFYELLCCLFVVGENPESKENKHITGSPCLFGLTTLSMYLWHFPRVKKTKDQL